MRSETPKSISIEAIFVDNESPDIQMKIIQSFLFLLHLLLQIFVLYTAHSTTRIISISHSNSYTYRCIWINVYIEMCNFLQRPIRSFSLFSLYTSIPAIQIRTYLHTHFATWFSILIFRFLFMPFPHTFIFYFVLIFFVMSHEF